MNELSDVMHAHLLHEDGAMHFDGALTDPQGEADLRIREASPDRAQNLALSWGDCGYVDHFMTPSPVSRPRSNVAPRPP